MNEMYMKFHKIYEVIKENMLIHSDQKHSFIENTQIFSMPIFYQILFLFTIIKTLLSTIYFIFFVNVYFNINIFLIFIQLSASFLLTQIQIIIRLKNKKFKKLNDSLLEQILKLIYIAIFCLEENMTMYYYDHLLLNLNPGFIFFIILLIIFFDLKTMRTFNEVLFYLYITNLVLLLYFLSIRNLMNFFLPINLILTMFVLLNIVSQSFNKKLLKMQLYHNFFESLISTIFKLNEMYVIYDKKILYHEVENENYENNSLDNYLSTSTHENIYDDNIMSEFSIIETKQGTDMKRLPIKGFIGFEIVYRNLNFYTNFKYFNKNQIINFLNMLFYLKNANSSLNNDKIYLSELETINFYSKSILRNIKLKKLVEENKLKIREKIILLMISLIIEAVCINNNIAEEIIYETRYKYNTTEIIFSNNFTSKKEFITLKNIIEELGKCLNYELKYADNKLNINFVSIKGCNDYLKLTNSLNEEEFILDDIDSIILQQSPRKFNMEN